MRVMGDHLTLSVDDGSRLTLSVDDNGRLHYKIEHPGMPDAIPIGGYVPDDLGLARLAVWARDTLRRQ